MTHDGALRAAHEHLVVTLAPLGPLGDDGRGTVHGRPCGVVFTVGAGSGVGYAVYGDVHDVVGTTRCRLGHSATAEAAAAAVRRHGRTLAAR